MPRKVLQPKGVAHVGLTAHDLVGLSAFYEERVGLHQIQRSDGCHIFDIGSGALLEIWAGGESSPPCKSPEQQSVRICFKVERLESAVEDMKSRGVTPVGEIGSYLGTRWVHYTDPEGNTFGFVDQNG
ncbi:MAG: VOC family protein [Burkholderiaceae bacterium]|nr:VOC family protein [Burkholderiaceae bacterium]